MPENKPSVDRRTLANLIPLNSLSRENFADLLNKLVVERRAAGASLFKVGERDNRALYLLSGELELRNETGARTLLSAGSQAARHAVAHQQPRTLQAVARTPVEYITIDNDLLDILLTWDQSAGYVVTELEATDEPDDADWMTCMLQSNIFHQVPPANIQQVFARLESLPVRQGEVVIRQGDAGDYYYVIRQGRAEVSRANPGTAPVVLAQLGRGDGFGEEALVSGAERNATITMLDDGMLMRLSKADFDELLKAPVLQQVDFREGEALVAEGARWLDVRTESEYALDPIAGSLNIPLYLLRLRIGELDPEQGYVVYCDSGQRSAAAAFLLSEAGFSACVLAGGLRNSQAKTA